jgi:hypothetical protein
MFEAKQTMDTIIPAFNHSLVRFSYTDTKPAVHMVTETATRLGWLVRQDGRHVEPITVEPEPIGSDEAWAIVTRAVSSLSRVLAAGRTHKIGASRFSPDGSNGSQRRLLNVMLMLHYTQLLRAAVTAALMLAVMRAALAGPLEDADAAYGKTTMQPPFGFFVCWPTKATQPRKPVSARCMRPARACRRITPKRWRGIAALLTKALRSRSGFSVRCIRPATACRRTTSKRSCGIIYQPRRAGKRQSLVGRA